MRYVRELLLLGGLLLFGAGGVLGCDGDEGAASSSQGLDCEVGYEDFAGPFVLNWCSGCHSSSLVGETARRKAPEGVNFDTLAGLRAHAEKIRFFAVDNALMPPLGGPKPEERALLGQWLDCGMPASGDGFTPPAPPSDTVPEAGAPPTGTCAEPRQVLPESVLPRCTAETHDCVIQCGLNNPEYGADACREACLAADGTPAGSLAGFPVDCPTCTIAQLLGCADQGGCHDETAAFVCCLEACGGGAACSQQCAGELQAFGLCVYYSAPKCVDYVDGPLSACFAAPTAEPNGAAGSAGAAGHGETGGAGGSGGG
jgi:hypothetical protein